MTTGQCLFIIGEGPLFGSVFLMSKLSSGDRYVERVGMVDQQLRARGIRHEGVLRAMSEVPRHEFVPETYRACAYDDRPLPIGLGQTISQPYMVAAMTEALAPGLDDYILEVGTGSGYQSAILAQLVREVVSFEWATELADQARSTLTRLGVKNVHVMAGDGSLGVGGKSFDGIMVTAGAARIPTVLVNQLEPNCRLVMPIGNPGSQTLTVLWRSNGICHKEQRDKCVFVPLQGIYGWSEDEPT